MRKGKLRINFVLKSESDKTKPALIYIMFTWVKRYKISIGQSVLPEYWDYENDCAIITSQQTQQQQRQLKRLNKYIKALKEELLNMTAYMYHKKDDILAGNDFAFNVKQRIKKLTTAEKEEIKQTQLKPSEFFQQYSDSVRDKIVKRTGTFRCKGTQINHYCVLKRYRDFLADMRYVDEFYLFNERFEEKFETWCLRKRGYTPNTVAASFSIFKIWLNEAEKQGLITDKAFHTYKTKATTPQHQYLNEEEIKKLYDIEFSDDLKKEFKIDAKSHIEESRDLFILACNLGLRLADWGILTHCEWDWHNNTVAVNTTKTKERVIIPISTQVKELYAKYKGKFPKPMDKTHINRHIQQCCKIAHIDKDVYIVENVHGESIQKSYKKYELITSHTGRRSFATNLYLKCKSAKMVMSFTGHKTEENFFKYICVDKIENAKLAQQYFT